MIQTLKLTKKNRLVQFIAVMVASGAGGGGQTRPGDLRSPYGEAPAKVVFTSVWNLAMFVAEVVTLVMAVSDPGLGHVKTLVLAKSRPWSWPSHSLFSTPKFVYTY